MKKIKSNDDTFLKHLTFWTNKTDEECIEMATNENVLNVEQALSNMVERDFCTSISESMVEKLRKIALKKKLCQ